MSRLWSLSSPSPTAPVKIHLRSPSPSAPSKTSQMPLNTRCRLVYAEPESLRVWDWPGRIKSDAWSQRGPQSSIENSHTETFVLIFTLKDSTWCTNYTMHTCNRGVNHFSTICFREFYCITCFFICLISSYRVWFFLIALCVVIVSQCEWNYCRFTKYFVLLLLNCCPCGSFCAVGPWWVWGTIQTTPRKCHAVPHVCRFSLSF